jgi:hypothetical protein
MDQIVMIQAGQYIDSTLGVTLGLATMTAAAAGQVVSDTTGVIFGGTLERFLTRMSFIKQPNLSSAQRQLGVCRNVSMAGAVVGVIVGCTLGAMTLLLVDLEARHRIERANKLREIVTDMISDRDSHELHAEACTLYIASSAGFTLGKKKDEESFRTSIALLYEAENVSVQECARTRELIHDKKSHRLYVPVLFEDEIEAVIEFRHNRDSSSGFSEADLHAARIMSRHLAIFMNRLME